MWDILVYLVLVVALAAALVGGALLARNYLSGGGTSTLFGPRPERRLDVVEHSNVDGRRKLVLIRRDDVEHLIMTGGPVDVVIETGIGQRRTRPITDGAGEAPAAVYSRPARTFGQAAQTTES